MQQNVTPSVVDSIKDKESTLGNELIQMAKKGYRIGALLERKDAFEKENDMDVELSSSIVEKIISSSLFYSVYEVGSVQEMLEELDSIKKTLVKSGYLFEITDTIRKSVTHGVTEYNYYSNATDKDKALRDDIQKLKANDLYLEDKVQTISNSASQEIFSEIK